jgi:hypothetical protein
MSESDAVRSHQGAIITTTRRRYDRLALHFWRQLGTTGTSFVGGTSESRCIWQTPQGRHGMATERVGSGHGFPSAGIVLAEDACSNHYVNVRGNVT